MKIFYSWQSDAHIPNSLNRTLIEKTLKKAANELNEDIEIESRIEIDSDTKGVSGAPNIPEAILRKIDDSDIFVCDVTIIGSKRSKYRPTPNPNVMFELGYAVKHIGWERVIMVINEYFGTCSLLPFDIDKRRVISYKLMPHSTDTEATKTKDILKSRIKSQIQLIVDELSKKNNPVAQIEPQNYSNHLETARKHSEEIKLQRINVDWSSSQKGVMDVINSFGEIRAVIEKTYIDNYTDIYEIQGIKKKSEFTYISLDTDYYGCQLEIKGIENWRKLSSIRGIQLNLVTFKKDYSEPFQGAPPMSTIGREYYLPVLDVGQNVIWQKKDNMENPLTKSELVNKFYTLLNDLLKNQP